MAVNKKDSLSRMISLVKKTGAVFLALLFVLLLLETGFRMVLLVQSSLQEYGNLQSARRKDNYRILCLGDSMTRMQYPLFLEQILNERHTGIHFSVIDKGNGGTNVPAIVSRVESYLAEYRPDMVVAMMGNDETDFGPFQDIAIDTAQDSGILRHSLVYRFLRMRFMHYFKKATHRDRASEKGSDPQSRSEEKFTVANKIDLDNRPRSENASQPAAERFSAAQGPMSLDRSRIRIPATGNADGMYHGKDTSYVTSGQSFLNQGKLSQAEEYFRKALEINPNNDRAYVGMGFFYVRQARSLDAENSFKKAIDINPKNGIACVMLADLYAKQGKSSQAEDLLKKSIGIHPDNDRAYIELGRFYQHLGEPAKAENAFKKAIELNPKNDKAYVALGQLYEPQGKSSEAENMFKTAIEGNPRNDRALLELGYLYSRHGKALLAEESFEKSVQINPQNDQAYTELALLYESRREWTKAEDAFKKAIVINPKNDKAYIRLSSFYRSQGDSSKAEALFKNAIDLNRKQDFDPNEERLLGAIATFYEEIGEPEKAKPYSQKINELRSKHYAPAIARNYHRLKQILDQRGIKLVCVQYPLRNIDPLKRMFENERGVLFVDNEDLFKKAVKKSGYQEYFRDMMAGDTGHCTPKGNQLLAQNIADVILREAFHRS